MKKVVFKPVPKEGYWEYHLPCGTGLLEQLLFRQIFSLEEEALAAWQAYLQQAGISYFGSEENSLLYALIVKSLAPDATVNLLTFGPLQEPLQVLNPLKIEKVAWKFSFEYTIDETFFCRQYGYQRPSEFLETMQYSNKDLSQRGFQLSELSTPKLEQFIKTYSSDVSSWSFFPQANWSTLLPLLQDSVSRPTIQDILAVAPCIVSVQIGEDEGYLDYVLIQSAQPLGQQIKYLEAVIFQFGAGYENLLKELGTIDEEWKCCFFEARLKELWKEAGL
ncbi:MAG: hypothetical protein ACRBFS_02285 [Aureispira sp.]